MRETRLYGLFEKRVIGGKIVHERMCSKAAFRKTAAVKIFQSLLLDGAIQGRAMELRPVKE